MPSCSPLHLAILLRDEKAVKDIIGEDSREDEESLLEVLQAQVTADASSESSRDERVKMMLGMSAFMLAAYKDAGRQFNILNLFVVTKFGPIFDLTVSEEISQSRTNKFLKFI